MATRDSVGAPASAAREHDLELARKAATGDRAAQRELFLAQRVPVHHALYRILGSNRELEDLLQDAFIEIFRALPSFRGDSTLSRWCQTIAVRVAYLAITRRRPPGVDLALVDEIIASDVDVRRHAMAREAARRLYAALDRIEVKQRIAFALAAIDGKSLAEVAELTDSSMFAVKTRVWRARRELMRRAGKDAVLSAYLAEFQGGES
jgi:RNA polymerase sigma-70 factor (ECF subfamily)